MNKAQIELLKRCAAKPNSIHEPGEASITDADQLANEGLLIKYNKPLGPMYSIGRFGAQYVKENFSPNGSPEMRKLALAYVVGKGYSEEQAEEIVDTEGVEKILLTQAEELRSGTQREVQVPLNERGEPEIKFRKA